MGSKYEWDSMRSQFNPLNLPGVSELYFSHLLTWGNFLISHLFHKSHNTKELIAEKSTHLSTMLSLWIVNHPLLAKIIEKGNNYKSIKIMEQKRDQLGRSPWHAIPYQMLRDRAAVSPPTSVSPVSVLPLPAHLVQAGIICWGGTEHWLPRWWRSWLVGSPPSLFPAALALPPTPVIYLSQPLSTPQKPTDACGSQGRGLPRALLPAFQHPGPPSHETSSPEVQAHSHLWLPGTGHRTCDMR